MGGNASKNKTKQKTKTKSKQNKTKNKQTKEKKKQKNLYFVKLIMWKGNYIPLENILADDP